MMIANVFSGAGFKHIPVRGIEFEFKGRRGEIDALFVYKNVLVICEDTTERAPRDHLNKTAVLMNLIDANRLEFIATLPARYPAWGKRVLGGLDPREYEVRYLYCSRNLVEKHHLESHPELKCLQFTSLRYFAALVKVIQVSARFELLKFLGVALPDVDRAAGTSSKDYHGFLLPDIPSGFPVGYKVLTFYIDPHTLLERAYVFRRDSWEDSEGLYQRMLVKNKIRAMRAYLAGEGRAFVNNVIVSLPPDVAADAVRGRFSQNAEARRSHGITVSIPSKFNCIGLIDGQHRVFAYHEGSDQHEPVIREKREKQQLLVTGILFPPKTAEEDRRVFEAKLFLEINDKQTRTRGDLRHAIHTIVEPFGAIALAKSVVSGLAAQGPLAGLLIDHFFGEGTIRTTSIVSYGLQHIVPIEGNSDHSFFRLWRSPLKRVTGREKDARDAYVGYCVSETNKFLSGFKTVVSERGMWTTDRKESRALTTTTINGLVYCLRLLIEDRGLRDFDSYRRAFQRLRVDFRPRRFRFRSSHWKALGERIHEECFEQ